MNMVSNIDTNIYFESEEFDSVTFYLKYKTFIFDQFTIKETQIHFRLRHSHFRNILITITYLNIHWNLNLLLAIANCDISLNESNFNSNYSINLRLLSFCLFCKTHILVLFLKLNFF